MAELLLINKLNFGDTFKNFTISFPKEKLIYCVIKVTINI